VQRALLLLQLQNEVVVRLSWAPDGGHERGAVAG